MNTLNMQKFLSSGITILALGLSLVWGAVCNARTVWVRFVLDQTNKDKGDIVAVLVQSEDEFINAMDNISSVSSFYRREVKANSVEKLLRFDVDDKIQDFAIIAFQDIQKNGKLDKGTFAPMEPVGFSNNPNHGFNIPKYEDVAITLGSSPREISVKVY